MPEPEITGLPEPVGSVPPAAKPSGPADDRAGVLYDQLLRLKAEFENYRKRVDRERPDWIERGKAAVWDKLLPLYDLLQQAHAQVAGAPATESGAQDIVRGLELLFKEFTRAFESEGVKPIESLGKQFHYDQHEAMGYVETDDQPEGTVVEELQRGYTLKGRVLRPARVKVARAKDEATEGN